MKKIFSILLIVSVLMTGLVISSHKEFSTVLAATEKVILQNSFDSAATARNDNGATLPYSATADFRQGGGGAGYSSLSDHTGNGGGSLTIGGSSAFGRVKFLNTIESDRLLTEDDVGRIFEVTFWARTKTAVGKTVTVYYGLLTVAATSTPSGGSEELSESWQEVTYNFTVTSDMVTSGAYCFSIEGISNSRFNDFFIDDLKVVEIDESAPHEPPTPPTDPPLDNVTYDLKNLVIYNSFNSAATARDSGNNHNLPYSSAFDFRGGGGGAVYSALADHTNNGGGSMTIGGSNNFGRAKFLNTVEWGRLLTEDDIGRSFDVSFWAKANTGKTPTIYCGMVTAESTAQLQQTETPIALSEEWQEFTYNFTITANMITSRAYCFTIEGNDESRFNSFFIDDLKVVETTSPDKTIVLSVDADGYITASGMLKSGNLSADIDFFILADGKTVENMSEPGVVISRQTVVTDSLGRYTGIFAPVLTDVEHSNLTLAIEAVGYEKKYICAVFPYEQQAAFLDLINNISNADESGLAVLLSDLDVFRSLGLNSISLQKPSDMTEVYAYMVRTGRLNTVERIRTAYTKGIIIGLLNESENGDEMDLIINEYADILGLVGQKIYVNTYLKLSDTEKAQVWSAVTSLTIKNEEELVVALFEYSIRIVLKDTVNYAAQFQILQDNTEFLKLDFSGYSSLSQTNKNNVAQEFATYAKTVTDIFDMNGKLRELIIKYTNTPSAPSNPGGSIGGGGGSGYISFPIATPTPSPNIENNKEVDKIPEKTQFNDLTEVEWAVESINQLAQLGIVSGEENKIFNPNGLLTREAFLKMLVIAFDLSGGDACSFSDVKYNDWFYPYVKTAEAVGLTNGKGGGIFGIGESITRQDMAIMAFRALQISGAELPNEDSTFTFDDISEISDYALQGVLAMRRNGIINGYDGYNFVPSGSATRAEAAKIVHSLLGFKK